MSQLLRRRSDGRLAWLSPDLPRSTSAAVALTTANPSAIRVWSLAEEEGRSTPIWLHDVLLKNGALEEDASKCPHGSSLQHTPPLASAELLRLPTYSPESNGIEGVWKATKKTTTHNRFYRTVDERGGALVSTFETIKPSLTSSDRRTRRTVFMIPLQREPVLANAALWAGIPRTVPS